MSEGYLHTPLPNNPFIRKLRVDARLRAFLHHVALDVLPAEYSHPNYAPNGISEEAKALLEQLKRTEMPIKVEHDPNAQPPPTPAHLVPLRPEPTQEPRKRKFSRPTTPELEALYFQTVLHQTKRETAFFMWAMGRTKDGGKALAEMFLSPGASE